ncbi:TlpA disulfide reductase family protein [Lutibacter sp. TH_r2]|uniref:TlpA family protein disulfide reductase n=1 Tax=Lutibacter sp. TH_r2 TaxID=3082083 RepID=UPI00295438CA|nr:TlpA disulfide reductase family protein [Lutibacter sp. TH_r2]MDV7186402.1 TlpA disulfide reductase family protein [Lutibacter sp. TH_r2]
MKKFLIIITLTIVQFSYSQENANRGYKVTIGEQAPKIDLTYLDGSSLTNESLKGKVTVLQFTASWCSVCIKEMPHLEKDVWQRFKNEDFTLIGIDLKETPEKVKKFISRTKVTYPFALDTDGKLFDSFTNKNAGVTRNIVLNKKGEIIFLTRLYNEEEFNSMIEVIALELKK